MALLFTLCCNLAAQPRYVVVGKPDAQFNPIPPGPNILPSSSGYSTIHFWRERTTQNTVKQEYIVQAAAMKEAGVPPGPIIAIGYRFLVARPQTMGMTISMKQVPADKYVVYRGSDGTTVAPYWSTSSMQTVMENPTFVMPAIANGDTTWVDFTFDKPFIWDGESNIQIHDCIYRENPVNDAVGTQGLYNAVYPPRAWNYNSECAYVDTYNRPTPGNICGNDNTIQNSTPMWAYNGYYTSATPILRIQSGGGFVQTFPDEVDPRRILRVGDMHNGSTPQLARPSVTMYSLEGETTDLTYRIVGPYPSTAVVYEGRQGGSSVITIPPQSGVQFTYQIPEATGPLAGTNGTLDLTNARGGRYTLELEAVLSNGISSTASKPFLITMPYDVTISDIRAPREVPRKNPMNTSVPFVATLQNVGKNAVTNADIVLTLRQYPGGQLMMQKTTTWQGRLQTAETSTIEFPANTFIPTAVGRYSVEMCATLKNAVDDQPANDCSPEKPDVHIFEVAYNEEVGAGVVQVPIAGTTYYAGRPIRTQGTIMNNGIMDLTDIPVVLEIYRGAGRTQLVYREMVIVPSVDAASVSSSVLQNMASVQFPLFVPTATGTYEACITTAMPGDAIADNNTSCVTFLVDAALEGTYTIGTQRMGQARNYTTVQSAVDDLYRKGVSGAVTYEFTDATYDVSSAASSCALDLSSTISGVSAKNTITFKPALNRAITRAGVVLKLKSVDGTGILFGQARTPSNPHAIALEFPEVIPYANSAGYITLDGGKQSALALELSATTPQRTAVMLGNGSRNITITNCIIRNAAGSTPGYASALDGVYSAGVANRASLPVGPDGYNRDRVDTITNQNNLVGNNEISGFGYGVVSTGIGSLLKSNTSVALPYYNTDTRITGNHIHDVAVAGVYAGYEKSLLVADNRITAVGKVSGAHVAAGIHLGGSSMYHVLDAVVTRNAIDNIQADSLSRGIVIEQVQNEFPGIVSNQPVVAPMQPEHTLVEGNVISDIRRASASATMIGIHLLTRRDTTAAEPAYAPYLPKYFTRKDTLASNTVRIGDDNVQQGTGAVACLAVQQGNGTAVLNNAMEITVRASTTASAQAVILYQGTLFRDGGYGPHYLPKDAPLAMTSDRNAIWNPNADVAHMIETTPAGLIVAEGSRGEFGSLAQWSVWTKQDAHSIRADFTAQPELLNGRGMKLPFSLVDIQGRTRGAGGTMPDIGAYEIDTRLLNNDLEVSAITSPVAYAATSGAFGDAEYHMTTAPAISARIRNNGALATNNGRVLVKVYMETAASSNAGAIQPQYATVPAVEYTATISLTSEAEKEITFQGQAWIPKTYADLAGYTIPARFARMGRNVTPRYRIEVSLQSDENQANNVLSKTVRLYVQRSNMHMMLSERTGTLAGRLNADSATRVLDTVGFARQYDVLDRTGWETRAIDYTMYRTLFWAHDAGSMLRGEREDLRRFLAAGSPLEKKNLALYSQEPVRAHIGLDPVNDEAFVRNVLRSRYQQPGSPGKAPSYAYDGKDVVGMALARGSRDIVASTAVEQDVAPVPALVKLYSDATTAGLAMAAYGYGADRSSVDSVMGTATASLNTNVVYLGVDWRHFAPLPFQPSGLERIVRGTIDFFEKNGGTVVPVELALFDAHARGNDVDVFWATASEQNTSHFNVQRARYDGQNPERSFDHVAHVVAGGNTTAQHDYSICDKGLKPGTYLYRLQAVDADGSTMYSGEVQVTIGGGGNKRNVLGNIVPNPVTNEAMVTIILENQSDVELMLIDAQGRVMEQLADGAFPAGAHQITVHSANHAQGTYRVVLRTGDIVETRLMTIVR